MAGHFPFASKRGSRYGLAPRMSLSAFFEHHGLNQTLQEKYYKWWYDWAKAYVDKDPDLSATVGIRFDHYPMGQHSEHAFHLNDKYWPVCMDELGSFVANLILPKLDESAMHTLEQDHAELLKSLEAEAKENPREPAPDVGLFRHV
jgi:hypothetical protein